jgi:8-oxo-dGTP pyrophosphatase MutT (NUDIX family)
MHNLAAGFLIDAASRVLLGRRAAWKAIWPGHWDCIGGHIEAGESTEAALIREIREEAGVIATDYAPLGVLEKPDVRLSLYVVRAWSGGAPTNCSDEHDELHWFSVEEMRALPLLVPYGYPDLLDRTAQ